MGQTLQITSKTAPEVPRTPAPNFNELLQFTSSYQEPLVEHVTLDVLRKHHEALNSHHRLSPASREAISLEARTIKQQPGFAITNCICLGLGSIAGIFRNSHPTFVNYATPFDLTPLAQLVAFEFWITMLKRRNNIQHVYFQDPQFNAVDKAFLNSLGYEVIDSPASKDLITTETFLYTPHTNLDVIYHTMKGSFPALYIGNHIHRLDDMWVEWPYTWIRSMIEKFLEDRGIIEEFVVSTYHPVWDKMIYKASMYYLQSSGEGLTQGSRRDERTRFVLVPSGRVGRPSSC